MLEIVLNKMIIMAKEKKSTISVQGTAITIVSHKEDDFISLTDMAKKFGGDDLIYSWMRNRNTLEFLGIWEQIHNPDFKGGEFETFKKEAGLNSFHLTPKKWIEATQAIGIQSRAGRYGGGTYAHKDLAFEFGSWLSPEFKLYLIKEFQRLKEDENRRLSLEWSLNRTLSKVNYRIHTDAIKENIIPANITKEQEQYIYANEADVLYVALFGITAQQWRKANPGKEGNFKRLQHRRAIIGIGKLRKHECRVYPNGFTTKRPPSETEHHSNSAIEIISGKC